MASNNISNIVLQILQSPELRRTLETTVRTLSSPQNPAAANTEADANSNLHETERTPSLPVPPPVRNLPPIGPTTPLSAQSNVGRELTRLFPSIRSKERPFPSTSAAKASPRSSKKEAVTSFQRDVILLNGPSCTVTLKGTSKSHAYEHGFAFSGVHFSKTWSPTDIFENINKLFGAHLDDTKFEILLPIGGRLVKPSLPPGDCLNGKALKAIFQQKVIYVRPLENIDLTPHKIDETVTSDNGAVQVSDNISLLDDNEVNDSLFAYENNFLCDDSLFREQDNQQFELDTEQAIRLSRHEEDCQNNNNNNHADDVIEEIRNEVDDDTFEISLEAILGILKKKINDDIVTKINVYRDDVFNCCIRALRRKSFSPFNRISVIFSDVEGKPEGAIDLGVPTRELFRLLLKHIEDCNLFFGSENKFITLNTQALKNNEYYEAGRIICLSIIHGEPLPSFFSKTLYSIVVRGISDVRPSLDDLEGDIRQIVDKLIDINELAALQEFVLEEQIFSIAGCQYLKTLEEKDQLVRDVLQFYVFHRTRPALEQFIDGLKTGGVFDLMLKHPNIFEDVMCSGSAVIIASTIENLFEVTFSEFGSNARSLESRIICYWRDFLIDCGENETGITPKDVLIFCTGADRLPPLGFDWPPKIVFMDDEAIYPKANTCGLLLHLPTVHKTYDDFKYHVTFGIANCMDFGFA